MTGMRVMIISVGFRLLLMRAVTTSSCLTAFPRSWRDLPLIRTRRLSRILYKSRTLRSSRNASTRFLTTKFSPSILLFLNLPPFELLFFLSDHGSLRVGNDLLSNPLGHFLVMIDLHRVCTGSLSNGSQVDTIVQHLCKRDRCLDDLLSLNILHAGDLATLARNVTHDVAHVLLVNYGLESDDWLQQDRIALVKTLLERQRSC